MPSAGFLKGLVITLGIAIFAALGFIVYGVVALGTKPDSTMDPALAQTVLLKQPAGSEFHHVGMSDQGYVISIRGGGLPDRILIVAKETGQIRQTIWMSDPP